MSTLHENTPADCYWTRICGGGNYLYLIRPAKERDPKVYGSKPL